MKILIIGGQGIIGRKVSHYSRQKHEVMIISGVSKAKALDRLSGSMINPDEKYTIRNEK